MGTTYAARHSCPVFCGLAGFQGDSPPVTAGSNQMEPQRSTVVVTAVSKHPLAFTSNDHPPSLFFGGTRV
jgi:hypothetical protein